MSYRLTGAVATDVGNVRDVNQDRGFVAPNLYAVADGMGGHLGGEVASTLTIEQFEKAPQDFDPGLLQKLAVDANDAVFARSGEEELLGMGTTLVAIALHSDDRVEMINVGDSRGYWLRSGSLAQVTRDHSFVGDLVEHNEITEQEAMMHPKRNIITRALGIADEVDVDTFALNVSIGDRFLLCSDGLTDEVPEAEIAEILDSVESPALACQTLVETALRYGGRDNVTCLVVDVLDDKDAGVDTEVEPAVVGGEEDEAAVPSAPEFEPTALEDSEHADVFEDPEPTDETPPIGLASFTQLWSDKRVRWLGALVVGVLILVGLLSFDRFTSDDEPADSETPSSSTQPDAGESSGETLLKLPEDG